MKNTLRWTPERLDAHLAKTAAPKPQNATTRMQALGRLKTGAMNKTEAAYAAVLDQEKIAGTVLWYSFEGLKFRLADNTFYSPDFAVMLADGNIQILEIKGFWTDDARVKIKIAAAMFPFQFIAIKKNGRNWVREEF